MSSSIDNILLRLASGGKGGEGSEINLLYLSILGFRIEFTYATHWGLAFLTNFFFIRILGWCGAFVFLFAVLLFFALIVVFVDTISFYWIGVGFGVANFAFSVA